MQYLGLGKTKFNSSVCILDGRFDDVELLLTERHTRKKNSGVWPFLPLLEILPNVDHENLLIGENRDVNHPQMIEDKENQYFPFFEYLKKNKLDFCLSRINTNIKFISHHLAHAYAALALCPFEKSIILVMDGAGNIVSNNSYEECTVFLQDGVNLVSVFQRLINFDTSSKNLNWIVGNQIGSSYEKVSEFIFNSPHSSGKVMGLAPFGQAVSIVNHKKFQEDLPWKFSYKGHNKSEWEGLDHSVFFDLAASVQAALENDYCILLEKISQNYPDYHNLVLVGGCALNCTNNAKIINSKKFDNVFVPPFPGDEGIAFGVAHYLKFSHSPGAWKPIPFEKQSAYFGSHKSSPQEQVIEAVFNSNDFEITKYEDITLPAASLLAENKILAWFQGRSESGPRALGNRSILVRPDTPGIKIHLNKKIKFRENFRPYGCSVLHEKASEYFEVKTGFDNPYMSYAVKVRREYQDLLQEVSHVDGTSRMQTVREGQNSKFYKLINNFGNLTGLYCLLNTSLNIMNEPIIETVQDSKVFLLSVGVDYLVIGNYIIRKKLLGTN